MQALTQVGSTAFSLAAVLCWGTSDFLGGYASRHANAFVLTTIAHASGMALMIALALLSGAQFPSTRASLWAAAAGAVGGAALALFYRALAAGNMGLIAPVSAVLGAAIPTVVTIATVGLPRPWQIVGFVLAIVGLWLISRSEGGASPRGFWTAVLAGLGFAGFYLFIKQAGDASALWSAVCSRAAATLVTCGMVLIGGGFVRVGRPSAGIGAIAGCFDVLGTLAFIHAEQIGRLDSAVVISSLYPALTVLLAALVLKERLTRWKAVGMAAALLAVPLVAS
jgi:drug/metabolite transporter (DMT)-like permease